MPEFIKEIDIGNTVLCDQCNEDFTNRDDVGGFLFSGRGVCPLCAPRMMAGIRQYNEEQYIKAVCPDNMSFRDFIIGLRGGNNKIQVISNSEEGAQEMLDIITSNPNLPHEK